TRMAEERWAERLWARDGGLWSTDPAGAGDVAFWTGWLDVIDDMNAAAGRLDAFAKSVRGDGFTHVVLAGMGGSSLCPDVLRRTFGILPNHPELHVIDSTDPATIMALAAGIDLARTLFIISSKSGGTTETLSHFRHFHERVRGLAGDAAGRQFVAITDEGSGL